MTLLMEKDILSEEMSRFYIAETILAIESVHNLNYIHRDLKPGNVVLDKQFHIKLIDFATCKVLNPKIQEEITKAQNKMTSLFKNQQASDDSRNFSLVGTEEYIAPETLNDTNVTYAADTFFDFDKSVLKADGKAKLDDLVGKVKGINLEVIIAVGHTDSVGSDVYNQKLSVKRAESVKAYLVSKGIEKNRIYTEGKGEKQPVADNKTNEGRGKNRRVEIEVVGTRAN